MFIKITDDICGLCGFLVFLKSSRSPSQIFACVLAEPFDPERWQWTPRSMIR